MHWTSGPCDFHTGISRGFHTCRLYGTEPLGIHKLFIKVIPAMNGHECDLVSHGSDRKKSLLTFSGFVEINSDPACVFFSDNYNSSQLCCYITDKK